MRVVVTTCNKYAHLMVGFAQRFNKFWGEEQVVDVVCYDVIPELPKNFHIHEAGCEPPGQVWTSGIHWFLHRRMGLREELFVLMLDDYWLNAPVDHAKVQQAELAMSAPNVAKVDLSGDRMNFPHEPSQLDGFVLSRQDARYRSSLQAAMWRKSYFLKLSDSPRNPWEFELIGEKECMNDGAMILGVKEPAVRYDNVMLKGVMQ